MPLQRPELGRVGTNHREVAQWTARALSGCKEMERAQEKEAEGGGRAGWEEQAGAHWVPR